MDKYEYSIKADKIRKLVDRRDYATAVKIADTIDWERVKNVKMLSTVSMAYEKLERYEDAKEVLLMAYETSPVGRRFLYRLTELAVKEGKPEEAETYLKEFAATSPKDPSRLILQYEIAQVRQEPLERLITILEAYQKREFEERWSYELASLYYRAGKTEECVKLCDEIILWFGVGPYVDKALELKQGIQPLTPEQLERKENKQKYLRQLENIQKEFEEKELSLTPERNTVSVSPAEQPDEKPTEPRKITKRQRRTEAAGAVNQAEPDSGAPAGKGMEPDPDMSSKEDLENIALQEEIETSLAKEIETAAMTATLNEMMLRETAATMEEVGAVNNDHSDTKERTKVVADRYTEQTREFAREAFVINEVLKEVTGHAIAADLIEEKLRSLAMQEALQGIWGETAAEEKPSAAAEPEKEPEKEPEQETVEEEPQEEEPAAGEEPEQETVEEEPQEEEPAAGEEPEQETVEEEPQEEEPAAGEEACEGEIGETKRMVHDHYILVAAADEGRGLQKSIAYIRDVRLRMLKPATQIAKITGQKLAAKKITKTMRKLQGRDLVISGIADLPDDILLETIRWMAEDQVESFIVLLDTREELDRLIARKPYFAACVYLSEETAPVPKAQEEAQAEENTKRISDEKPKGELETGKQAEPEADRPEPVQPEEAEPQDNESENRTLAELVEEALRKGGLEAYEESAEKAGRTGAKTSPGGEGMQPKQFVETAKQYACMLDAIIDEMGELALFALAEDYVQEREPLTEELAQEVVERAILRAEKRSLKNLLSNRYDKDGYLILKEKHLKEDW